MAVSMQFDELMEIVESLDYSMNINILSGFKILIHWLAKDEILSQLIALAKQSKSHREAIYQRLLQLLPSNPEPDYLHPHDAAITAYLYVLDKTEAAQTEQVIKRILETGQLWWAKRLALHLEALSLRTAE
jgi:hypothetical protein